MRRVRRSGSVASPTARAGADRDDDPGACPDHAGGNGAVLSVSTPSAGRLPQLNRLYAERGPAAPTERPLIDRLSAFAPRATLRP